MRQFLVFVREASKLGNRGIWQVHRIEAKPLEFLRRATLAATSDKGRGVGRNWTSNLSGALTTELMQEFQKSSEWRQYEALLLQVAEMQEKGVADPLVTAVTSQS